RCLLLCARKAGLHDNGYAHHLAGSPDRLSASGLAHVSVTVGLCFTSSGIAEDAARTVWLCYGRGRDLPAGLIIFYFWPTVVPAANIDWAAYPEVDFLKSMDASGNACLSLHVATA